MGAVPVLIHLLADGSSHLQILAAKVLKNCCNASVTGREAVEKGRAIPIFVKLLSPSWLPWPSAKGVQVLKITYTEVRTQRVDGRALYQMGSSV